MASGYGKVLAAHGPVVIVRRGLVLTKFNKMQDDTLFRNVDVQTWLVSPLHGLITSIPFLLLWIAFSLLAERNLAAHTLAPDSR